MHSNQQYPPMRKFPQITALNSKIRIHLAYELLPPTATQYSLHDDNCSWIHTFRFQTLTILLNTMHDVTKTTTCITEQHRQQYSY